MITRNVTQWSNFSINDFATEIAESINGQVQ